MSAAPLGPGREPIALPPKPSPAPTPNPIQAKTSDVASQALKQSAPPSTGTVQGLNQRVALQDPAVVMQKLKAFLDPKLKEVAVLTTSKYIQPKPGEKGQLQRAAELINEMATEIHKNLQYADCRPAINAFGHAITNFITMRLDREPFGKGDIQFAHLQEIHSMLTKICQLSMSNTKDSRPMNEKMGDINRLLQPIAEKLRSANKIAKKNSIVSTAKAVLSSKKTLNQKEVDALKKYVNHLTALRDYTSFNNQDASIEMNNMIGKLRDKLPKDSSSSSSTTQSIRQHHYRERDTGYDMKHFGSQATASYGGIQNAGRAPEESKNEYDEFSGVEGQNDETPDVLTKMINEIDEANKTQVEHLNLIIEKLSEKYTTTPFAKEDWNELLGAFNELKELANDKNLNISLESILNNFFQPDKPYEVKVEMLFSSAHEVTGDYEQSPIDDEEAFVDYFDAIEQNQIPRADIARHIDYYVAKLKNDGKLSDGEWDQVKFIWSNIGLYHADDDLNIDEDGLPLVEKMEELIPDEIREIKGKFDEQKVYHYLMYSFFKANSAKLTPQDLDKLSDVKTYLHNVNPFQTIEFDQALRKIHPSLV